MENLFKALGIFQQSVQNAAITQGIMGAKDQVDQINQSNLSALEKRQQQSQLANQLALQLTGIGADPNRVSQAVGAVAPPVIKDSNDAFTQALQSGDEQMLNFASKLREEEVERQVRPPMMLQDDQQEFLAGQNALDRQTQRDINIGRTGRAVAKEDRKFLHGFQKDYSKAVIEWNKQKQPLMNAVSLIDGKAEMAVSAMGVLFARGSGNTGALTEKEQDVWKGVQDVVGKWQRLGATEFQSQMTARDRAALKKVARFYAQNGETIMDDITNLYVNQAAQAMPETDLDQIGDYITGGRWSKKQGKAKPASSTKAPEQNAAPASGASGSWGAPQTTQKPNINKYWIE